MVGASRNLPPGGWLGSADCFPNACTRGLDPAFDFLKHRVLVGTHSARPWVKLDACDIGPTRAVGVDL